MNKIETFNHQLNESLLQPSKKTKAFRMQVDLLLKSVLQEHSYKKALILGAGKMNDFSLNFFVRIFSDVLLTDVDISTVKDELQTRRMKQRDKEKVRLKQIEYTGFEESGFFEGFKERMMTCRDFDAIDRVFQSLIKPTKEYCYIKDESFDFIYISPIYTQLVHTQFMHELRRLQENGYPPHLSNYIEELMLEEMVPIIELFNETTIKALNDGGMIFVLSDIFQVDIGSDFQRRIQHSIHNFDVMEEIYMGYQEKYGYGLGDFGLRNLDEKLEKKTSKWLIWPFQDSTEFIVKLTVYKKNNKEENK